MSQDRIQGISPLATLDEVEQPLGGLGGLAGVHGAVVVLVVDVDDIREVHANEGDTGSICCLLGLAISREAACGLVELIKGCEVRRLSDVCPSQMQPAYHSAGQGGDDRTHKRVITHCARFLQAELMLEYAS